MFPIPFFCFASVTVPEQGVEYNHSIDTGWKAPWKLRKMSQQEQDAARYCLHTSSHQPGNTCEKCPGDVLLLRDGLCHVLRPCLPSPWLSCSLSRKKWAIIVEGENVPPPVTTFKEMKFPQPVIDHLKSKNIMRPTPIQVWLQPLLRLSCLCSLALWRPRIEAHP